MFTQGGFILCNIWLIVEDYFQTILNPLSPTPPEKIHSPFKNSKVQVLLPFGQHYKFFSPTSPTPPHPSAERVGGHCELAFPLLVVLFSITDLDKMYFLRNIFPPSEVLEVCIYSHLSVFIGENPVSRSVGILAGGKLTRSDSDI